MKERVLTDVAVQLLSRHRAACECFRCRSLRDLIDARTRIAGLERERDEARKVLEAARHQYDAAGSVHIGWTGSWWLSPRFQGAAIELHRAVEAAARAAAGESER